MTNDKTMPRNNESDMHAEELGKDGDSWDDSGDSEYEEPSYDPAVMKKFREEFLKLHEENQARQREADMRAQELKRQRDAETSEANAAAERKRQERLDEMERQRGVDRERRARERAASPHCNPPDAYDFQRDFEDYLQTHQKHTLQ